MAQYLMSVLFETADLATGEEMAAIDAFNEQVQAEGHWVFAGGLVGSRAVSRARGPVDQLTPQEVQVVRLAAAGMSNREAAGRLFLSPRTIEAHLYKAYRKLGVSSRAELADLDLAPSTA